MKTDRRRPPSESRAEAWICAGIIVLTVVLIIVCNTDSPTFTH